MQVLYRTLENPAGRKLGNGLRRAPVWTTELHSMTTTAQWTLTATVSLSIIPYTCLVSCISCKFKFYMNHLYIVANMMALCGFFKCIFNVMFWFVGSLCNDWVRVAGLAIPLSIYHSFVLRTFKIFSSSCFEVYGPFCQRSPRAHTPPLSLFSNRSSLALSTPASSISWHTCSPISPATSVNQSSAFNFSGMSVFKIPLLRNYSKLLSHYY